MRRRYVALICTVPLCIYKQYLKWKETCVIFQVVTDRVNTARLIVNMFIARP